MPTISPISIVPDGGKCVMFGIASVPSAPPVTEWLMGRGSFVPFRHGSTGTLYTAVLEPWLYVAARRNGYIDDTSIYFLYPGLFCIFLQLRLSGCDVFTLDAGACNFPYR